MGVRYEYTNGKIENVHYNGKGVKYTYKPVVHIINYLKLKRLLDNEFIYKKHHTD